MTQKDYNLEEIKTLEEKLLNPLIRKSSIEVSKLLADDFIEYGSSGLIYNKQIVINDLQSECPINFGTRDFKIKKLATDVILATYIAVKYNDTGIEESSSLRSSIWKLNDGNWQMIFHQGTKIFDDVILEEYNINWPVKAATEINIIKQKCKFNWICDIQHFGSTAIIGLKSKPIIDIMIGVTDINMAQALVPVLESMGYCFWSDNPKKDRMFFVKGMPPYGKQRTHHIHVFEVNSYEWMARQAFRDYLNTNPEERAAYQNLKEMLANKFFEDRETYTSAKSEFVDSIVKNTAEYKISQDTSDSHTLKS